MSFRVLCSGPQRKGLAQPYRAQQAKHGHECPVRQHENAEGMQAQSLGLPNELQNLQLRRKSLDEQVCGILSMDRFLRACSVPAERQMPP